MSTYNELTIAATEALFDALSPVTCTYKPSGGSEREIEALIFYTNENVYGRTRGRVPIQTIIVRNDTTTGIGSDEFNSGLDAIEMPVRQGAVEVKDFTMEIANQNAAFLRLQVK